MSGRSTPRTRPSTPDIGEMDEAAAIESLKRSFRGKTALTFVRPEALGENPENVSLPLLARRIEGMNIEEERRWSRAQSREVRELERRLEIEIVDRIKQQLETLTAPDTSDQRVLVEPPTTFSRVPTLTTPAKLEMRKAVFTCLNTKSKFTGEKAGPSRGELDVVSLLESLSRGQQQMELSEEEFLNVFISSCAGTPQNLLVDYIKLLQDGDMSISEVYLRFTDMFFHDLRPEQALQKLKGIKHKHNFVSLADADNSIRKLAKLASLGERTVERRRLFFQKFYRDTLLAIIPDKFISVILQQIETKETLSQRELQASDLLGICRAFRVDIDTIFYSKNNGQRNDGNVNKASGKKNKGTNDGNVGAVQTRSQSQGNSAGDNSRSQQQNSNSRNNGNNGSSKNFRNNGHRNGNNKNGNHNSRNGKGGNGNGHGNGNDNGDRLSMQECKLCMQRQHNFNQCPLFKAHERVISTTMCSCPMKAYHLQKHCPIKSKNC